MSDENRDTNQDHDYGVFYLLYFIQKKSLDRDNMANIGALIEIVVLVTDNGVPNKLTAMKQTKISHSDLNDNLPHVLNSEQLKQVNVFEDQELGKSVILIKVIKYL